jgi:hypothetical protein
MKKIKASIVLGKWTGFLALLLIFFLLQGCLPKEEGPSSQPIFLADYFPISQGSTLQYKVDSLLFYEDGLKIAVDTTLGELSREWKQIQVREDGVQEILMEKRYQNDKGFASSALVLYEIEEDKIFYTHNNLRFFLLPLKGLPSKSWRGLLFDPKQVFERIGQSLVQPYLEWESEVEAIGITYQLGGKEYPDVMVLVRAKLEDSLLELRLVREWYAKGIGLIASERWILDSKCIECDPEDWPAKAFAGYVVREELIME